MPARRALHTLTLCFDVAVFLWRRYLSVAQRPTPVPDGRGVEPLDHIPLVLVAEDNDSEDLSPERTQTVTFGLDGQNYAIDLSDQNAAELRQTLGRYIAAGRRAGRRTRTANIAPARPRAGQPAQADGRDTAAIRQWARVHTGSPIEARSPRQFDRLTPPDGQAALAKNRASERPATAA
jgi:Lsr2